MKLLYVSYTYIKCKYVNSNVPRHVLVSLRGANFDLIGETDPQGWTLSPRGEVGP
jgi:hypothetical protein